MRFKPQALSANAWAIRAGVSRTVWADMRRHGNPSRRTLEKLLSAAGSSLAEFEALRIGPAPRSTDRALDVVGDPSREWRAAGVAPLSLIESSLAGGWGNPDRQIELTHIRPGAVLDRLARPASLAFDADAYALTVVGDSMWPRFRPGRPVAVSPRSPVAVGDDVLVLLRSTPVGGAQQVLLKQLVKRTANRLELRQFNPGLTFEIDLEEVESIAKVAGELI